MGLSEQEAFDAWAHDTIDEGIYRGTLDIYPYTGEYIRELLYDAFQSGWWTRDLEGDG